MIRRIFIVNTRCTRRVWYWCKGPVILRPDNSFEVKKLAELERVNAPRMVTWELFYLNLVLLIYKLELLGIIYNIA
jgi:hypothetical protein